MVDGWYSREDAFIAIEEAQQRWAALQPKD
jgi:hypothetical protein